MNDSSDKNFGSDQGSDPRRSSRNLGFAKRMAERRSFLGYTQQKISKLTGIGLKTIQNYESGTLPKGDYAIRLAENLDCSIDWLLIGGAPAEAEPPLYNKVEQAPHQMAAPESQDGPQGAPAEAEFWSLIAKAHNVLLSKTAYSSILSASIIALHQTLQAGTGLDDQAERIKALEKECERVKNRLATLEEKPQAPQPSDLDSDKVAVSKG